MARKFVNKNVAKRGISRLRRERKAPVSVPVDHRKGALFGSVSAFVLGAALLAGGGVKPAAAACTPNFNPIVLCGPGPAGPVYGTFGSDFVGALGADIFPDFFGNAITTGPGNDFVFLVNSDVWGDIELGTGDDLLVVNAIGGFPGDDVVIFGDVNGGAGDDTLVFNSFGPGADIFVGEINGDNGFIPGSGDDQIYLNAGFGGEIWSFGGINGNGGNDIIDLDAFAGGEIHLFDDITGGSGNDDISAFASTGGLIRGEDIFGGTGDDDITLVATRGGTVDFDHLGGGDGDDDITAIATRGGRVEIDQGISGGIGEDNILLVASRGGDIILDNDIWGGDDNDNIVAVANRGGLIRGEDIWGGDGDDNILLAATRGGTVDFDEVSGGNGQDNIFAFADRGGRVEIDQGISGGDGYDDILLAADRGGDVVVGQPWADGDVSGGNQGDNIGLIASRGGDITVWGDVDGDSGLDNIALIAFDGGDIYVDDSVQGGDDNDNILLFATGRRSDIEVDEDVEGGNGQDNIALIATRGAEIDINDDVEGNDGSDHLLLAADRGGDIDVDGNVDGGSGSDYITLAASRGGDINVDDNVRGGSGIDNIALIATSGGDINVDEYVQGGDDNDNILLFATGRRSDIDVGEDVEGGNGQDNIALIATRGAEIHIDDDVQGNDGYDSILLAADRGGEVHVRDDVQGGDDGDDITLLATRGGDVRVDGNVEGNSGIDNLALIADRGGNIYVDGDVRGGSGGDSIFLFANRGGLVDVDGDVSGGDGGDFIGLLATNGGDIDIGGDVEGGDGDDVIAIAAFNTNSITIGEDIEGNDDDDLLLLVNLNNQVGDPDHNFNFNGEVDGGRGYDRMVVALNSNLSLDEVERWQQLYVVGNSRLELTGDDYRFLANDDSGRVVVGGTSVLRLSDRFADLETNLFLLRAGAGYNGDVLDVGDQYNGLSSPGAVLDLTNTGSARVEIGSNNNPVEFVNYGTINMRDADASDRLTIHGSYEGGGNLVIDTVLGDSDSDTDLLRVNGTIKDNGYATIVYVTNTAPGNGTYTGLGDQDGIKIVDSSGSNVSAEDAFALGINKNTGAREVIDGVFAYRLFQSQTDGDWYLRSDLVEGTGTFATASSAAQRHFYAGMDTLYKRLGELKQQDSLEGRNADLATKAPAYIPAPAPKWQAWIRGGGADLSYEVDKGWDFDQTTYGLQGGADYTFDYNASRISFGAFGGYGWSKADVHDTFFYGNDKSNLDINGWNAGIYATFRQVGGLPGTGWYVDLVGKVDVLDVDMNGDVDGDGNAFKANTNATAWGGSGEVGYGFDLGNGFVVQPQGQLTYVNVSQDAYTSSTGIEVRPDDADSLVGRLGVQLQTTVTAANGMAITPWAIFNVLSEFAGDNDTNVAGVILASDIGGTWYNAGAGFNAAITENVAVYGSGEYNFGDVEGWAGTAGVKVRW
jgi:outer membrane autotransporter protein